MRVLVPTGDFQYDVANGFARDLAAGIASQAGQEVAVLPLKSSADLRQALHEFKPDLVLAIQGIGINAPEAAEAPDTAWMVMGIDHPSHIFGRIEQIQAKKTLITAFEASHLPCWKILAPEIPCAFLAHPAPVAPPNARKAELGLSFLGTWNSPEEMAQKWQGKFPEAVIERLTEALSQGMNNHCAIASELLDFREPIWLESRRHYSLGMSEVDLLLRLILRSRLLHELDDAGIGIDIFGNGWKAADWRHHRIHQAVSYAEALNIGARSLGVLSITPSYPAGSHERPLSCLAQGSVCLSSPSSFYRDAGFTPGLDYLEYDPWVSGSLTQAVKSLPDFYASTARKDAVSACRFKVLQNHSAKARARQILGLAKDHFGLD